jgi:hypothetical protein
MRKIAHKYDWEYTEPWECTLLTDEGRIRLTVLKGYRTDLASVPQALKGLIDNGSGDFGVMIACQVHDILYSTNYLSKPLSDELFYLILRAHGMGWFKAQAYYKAVKWFGDSAYYDGNDEISQDRMLCKLYWTSK